MPDILLTNAYGEDVTYKDVEAVTLRTTEAGVSATYTLGGGTVTNADYAQNDPAQPDYIKNRPFYVEESLNELLPATPIPFEYIDDMGAFGFSTPPTEEQLQAWNDNWDKCIVTYDGTVYECEPKYIDGVKLIGNAEAFAGTGNSGHPFIFTITDELTGTMLVMMQSTVDTQATTHTIAISFSTETVQKLDPKFIENIDWETQIINKPFGEGEIVSKTWLSSTGLQFVQMDEGGFVTATVIALTSAQIELWAQNWKSATITWDGTEYICNPQPTDLGGGSGVIIKVAGNAGVLPGGTNTEEPFVVLVDDGSNLGSPQVAIFSLNDDTSNAVYGETVFHHSVTIDLDVPVIKTIDPKYLPGNISGLLEVTTDDNDKVLKVVDGNATWSNITSGIPDIVDTDNGKILAVENNEIVYKTAPIEVPSSTSLDNGKFLRVVNGIAAWSVVQDASEVLF